MLINEAVEAKRLGVANDEDIELAMQKGVNYPKGLLSWGKEIGYSKSPKLAESLRRISGRKVQTKSFTS
jgi:3-hydroxybutyryl-CoA dehydrogenase